MQNVSETTPAPLREHRWTVGEFEELQQVVSQISVNIQSQERIMTKFRKLLTLMAQVQGVIQEKEIQQFIDRQPSDAKIDA